MVHSSAWSRPPQNEARFNQAYKVCVIYNHENVAVATADGVWSTPPQNEARLKLTRYV